MPKVAAVRIRELIEDQWPIRLVRGWNEGWYGLSSSLGAKIARLIGAHEDEVIVADSTSVNLFKLTTAALRMQSARRTIVSEIENFPSDLYVLEGCAGLFGGRVVLAAAGEPCDSPMGTIERHLDSETALLSLSHVSYRSGYVHDMAKLNQAAQACGAKALWDLSHSVGAVPIDLLGSGADMAVGCTYKYLNGGPGSPAFLYVRRELQDRLSNPIQGWFGHHAPFSFLTEYDKARGIAKFLSGTPPILSLAAVEAGIDLCLEAGMEAIRTKSVALTELLIEAADRVLLSLGFEVITPRDPSIRGSHVALRHPDAWRIDRALIEKMDVIPDFRAPDVVRFGLSPLYTSYAETVEAVARTASVLQKGLQQGIPGDGPVVT